MERKQHNGKEQNKTTDNHTTDNEFPGYPHYSPKEDIMDGRSEAERVKVDVENLPNFHNATTSHRLNPQMENERSASSTPTNSDEGDTASDLGIKMGTEADVSAEERMMLEDDMYYPTRDEDNLRHARLDDTDFDGDKLNEESFGTGQTQSGDGLDMENSNNEKTSNAMDDGDEENQYYSLGSAANDDMVEGTP